jgi:hypothetical protein
MDSLLMYVQVGKRHQRSCRAGKGVALALLKGCVEEAGTSLTCNAELKAHHLVAELKAHHLVAARVVFRSRKGQFLPALLSCHWLSHCHLLYGILIAISDMSATVTAFSKDDV